MLPSFISGIESIKPTESMAFSQALRMAMFDPAPIRPSKIIKDAIIIRIVSASGSSPDN